VDSSELEKKGFVRSVENPEELLDTAKALASRISRHSPVAVALTRQMMYRNASKEHPVDAHKIDSLAIFYTSQTSGKEGVAAFLEKRAPNFQEQASNEMPPFYPWW
jgi:enoyl-CoA hydratase/carnithine racemase